MIGVPGPCPFCGSTAIYDGINHSVTCENNACGGGCCNPYLSHYDVIANWNERSLKYNDVELAALKAESAAKSKAILEKQDALLSAILCMEESTQGDWEVEGIECNRVYLKIKKAIAIKPEDFLPKSEEK